MTRFARAKGSKASNERTVEESTPWSTLKSELLEKLNNKNDDFEDVNNKKIANYAQFLKEKEEEQAKNVVWAAFPTQKNNSILGHKNNKFKKSTSENENKVAKKNMPSNKAEIRKKKKLKVVNAAEKIIQSSKNDCTNSVNFQNKLDSNSSKKKMKVNLKSKIEKSSSEQNNNSENKKRKKDNASRENKNIKSKNLSEIDLKKIEKKKQKKMKQLEKKKLFKQKSKDEQKNILTPDDNKTEYNEHQNIEETVEITNDNNSQNLIMKIANKPKMKTKKEKLVNGEHYRKKPTLPHKMFINGKELEISYVDGFPVKKEDAERLKKLRKEMISKGLPRSEIDRALKLERRKAEKALAREKKKVCFNCRKSGHNLSECPELGKDQLVETTGMGICFKCGSAEHTHFECKVVKGQEYKFAQCFICNEQGHISRQCPDNARGLYPKGGACKVCGDVTHLKRDCPQYQDQQQKEENNVQLDTLGNSNPEMSDSSGYTRTSAPIKKQNKIIKFS